MKKNKILTNLSKYYLIFMFYAIIGWCYEVFLEVVVYKWGFSNRGVLFGPYCPVYGMGALIFIFCFYKIIKDKTVLKKILYLPIIFFGCMLSATLLELITSYICEFFLGSWPWQTYVDYNINFQGRIALSPSIRFGLGGLLFLYIIQPLIDKLLKNMNPKVIHSISMVVFIIFIIDIIYTFLF